jgi:uncharacterized membrane protein
MKRLIASLCVAGLVACTGCNSSSTGGRQANATNPGKPGENTTTGKDEKFELDGPKSFTVKQGEMKEFTVTISRTNFKDDVTLTASVENTDNKVKAEVKDKTFKGSDPKDKKIAIAVSAADDAKLGDYTIDVNGKPEAGHAPAVPLQVKLKVEKK